MPSAASLTSRGELATSDEIQEEIRESLATIERQRSRKLVLAITALIAILVAMGAFVYLSYSSEPGTFKPLPASQR